MKYRKTNGNRIISQSRKSFNIKMFQKNSAEKTKTEVFVSFVTRGTYIFGNVFVKNQEAFLKLASTIAGRK